MRHNLDKDRLTEFFRRLGHSARTPGNCYLTGGATAVWHGWRETTIDVDLKLDPEPGGVFEALAALKGELQINIELASPELFIPELKDWRSRSSFIGTFGRVSFFHYDYIAQALAKLERGHAQDLFDVHMMFSSNLVTQDALLRELENIKAALSRYPAIDPEDFVRRVNEFLSSESAEP